MSNEKEKDQQQPKEVRYLVLRDCYGFTSVGGRDKKNRAEAERQQVPSAFYTRIWKKGEEITLRADIEVPKHFHDLRQPTPQAARAKRHAINERKVRKITRQEV